MVVDGDFIVVDGGLLVVDSDLHVVDGGCFFAIIYLLFFSAAFMRSLRLVSPIQL